MLSYLRRHTPFSAVEAIADCGLPVRIYGLGERDPVGNCSFHAIDERRFVDDLAGCRCLVSAAGNQLIGEALHLGKPMLVLPERAHSEQLMNSHFLGCDGLRRVRTCSRRSRRTGCRRFLGRLDSWRPALAAVRGRMDGTDRRAAGDRAPARPAARTWRRLTLVSRQAPHESPAASPACARARWLMTAFTAAGSSPKVRWYSGTMNSGS